MFDTMTMTKIVGGFCGALLVFLLGNWVAESLYSMGGGHGDDHAQAYVIETGAEDTADEADEGPDFPTLMAAADAGAGAKVFSKCKACHKIDGSNSTGPHLDGVVGRTIDAVEGFGYSGALLQVGETWTPENLFHFLESPKAAAPGTKMSFAGLKKPTDRVNLIAYLDSISQ
ncbi:cytochrome c family protein [Pseudooceanicola sp.]|uniref:c-type cytochrome n=1 Tax=Pseudooceanicola sp. TaxID=1914328 RepID=UPI00261C5326|nr:cytochrome c family protein [Pseudooceanicola sp.]MDF1855115.1 cytochrome c family protein [Pseudooceanicola sp.]